MTRKADALPFIEEYATLQEQLIRALVLANPNVASWDRPTKLPRTGTVEAASEQWRYQQHGAGVLFLGTESGRVVDAHRLLGTQPRGVDGWRLEQYAEAKKVDALVYRHSHFESTEKGIEECLVRLVDDGALRRIDDTRLWVLRLAEK